MALEFLPEEGQGVSVRSTTRGGAIAAAVAAAAGSDISRLAEARGAGSKSSAIV